MSKRWDEYFLCMAGVTSLMSKDPSTKVGSVIVDQDRIVVATGFNGFPRGISDTEARLVNRDIKLKLVVHAEMNAILAAARRGVCLNGCALYLAATDSSGLVWGGPPCTRCTVEIIQAGISEIVAHPFKSVPSKWKDDIEMSRELLVEAGVIYREVDFQITGLNSGT